MGDASRSYDDPSAFEHMPMSEQNVLLEWIRDTFVAHRLIADIDSYCLKHVFQRGDGGFYVTNGQFKGAMVVAGFLPETTRENNWRFRIKRKRPCPYALYPGRFYDRASKCHHTPSVATGVCSYHRIRLLRYGSLPRYEEVVNGSS